MSDGACREMTLDEWVATLPKGHQAEKELTALRAEVVRQDLALSDACELLDSALGSGPDCDCGSEGHICGWTKWQDATRKFLDAALRARRGGKEEG